MFNAFARRIDLGLDREPPQLDPPPVMVPLKDVVVPDKTGLGTRKAPDYWDRGAYHLYQFVGPGWGPSAGPGGQRNHCAASQAEAA